MTLASTGIQRKPALDESSFQKLLAAAYVVQQHNDGCRSKDPAQTTSGVLSEIAEIQGLVRGGGLDLQAAAHLTAARLRKITGANGVSIVLFDKEIIHSLAESGQTPGRSDEEPIISKAFVAIERIRQGQLLEVRDARADIRLDVARCRDSGVESLIATPIHCVDVVAGFVEVRWEHRNAFQETDIRACRLMAGLIGGILERNARAKERERISPQSQVISSTADGLSHVTEDSGFREFGNIVPFATESRRVSSDIFPPEVVRLEGGEAASLAKQPDIASNAAGLPDTCRVCGRPFGGDEVFCGKCSMPRIAGASSEDLQSKWASLWYMQRAQEAKQSAAVAEAHAVTPPIQPSPSISSDDSRVAPQSKEASGVRIWHVPESTLERVSPEPVSEGHRFDALIPHHNSEFAETLETPRTLGRSEDTAEPAPHPDLLHRTWQTAWLRVGRRHTVWALSVVGFLLLFLMLAVWPSSSDSQLTMLQSLLVQLGLAEVPAHPPALGGSPEVRVWVDVHTALYYCPGSDMYGKTPGGHFASQLEAQQDQFDPANRVPCP